jgi:hypothetical protein
VNGLGGAERCGGRVAVSADVDPRAVWTRLGGKGRQRVAVVNRRRATCSW